MADYRLTLTLTRKTKSGRETVASHRWNGEAASVNANGIKLRMGGELICVELVGLQSPDAPKRAPKP